MSKRPLVLIIDDEPEIQRALRLRLQAAGYAVMTAGDAPTGLELACRHLPSVILLDLRMPGMDGFGALASLRAHPASAHTPIIVSSANIAEDAREKARALGANLFLPKPLRPNALNKAIEAALGAGVAP